MATHIWELITHFFLDMSLFTNLFGGKVLQRFLSPCNYTSTKLTGAVSGVKTEMTKLHNGKEKNIFLGHIMEH